ncbi:hypothetical protein EDE09_11631 [Neorhizobium sp. S3-V5DH]|nr:hypothetical protein EDE09_11631 [Neorhizobium sp. S3-V5DH]
MSEKPLLTDREIHSLLNDAWIMLAKESGATEYGNNTLKAARLALFTLQMTMMMKMEGITDHTPAEPSSRSD